MVRVPFNSSATLAELIASGAEELFGVSSSPRLDSEVLLCFVLNISKSSLLTRLREHCPVVEINRFEVAISRRKLGEPVAYITGEREFWGISFQVSPAVLVPRPETELVVERAVSFLRQLPTKGVVPIRFIDLGTGSGCIAISILIELKRLGFTHVSCDAVDLSVEALSVAEDNAKRLGVNDQIRFIRGSWFSSLSEVEVSTPPYDCIVANPPYIDRSEVTPVELSFEPQSALFSGDGGLGDVAEILASGAAYLKAGGLMLCEVGAGKRAILPPILEPYRPDFDLALLGDDSSADRFTVLSLLKRI